MRLRCRAPNGQHAFGSSLTPQSTLLDLRHEVMNATSIPVECQLLRIGFPPKPLVADNMATLQAVGIKDGDTVVVEQSTEPRTATPTNNGTTTSGGGIAVGGLARASETAASAALQARPQVPKDGEDGVAVEDGLLVVRQMEDDNSCLFRSMGYVLDRTASDPSILRRIIADTISKGAQTDYNAAILGRDPKAYCEWILKPASWGGGIELAIFSDHFGIEIDSIDVATLRVDRFGEGQHAKRVIILYTGIHYDAVALTPSRDAHHDFDQTTFEGANADTVLDAAVKLAGIWKQKRKFTDLANFTLRCAQCKQGLTGQKEAQAHAMATGHSQFTEF
ncbi:hypothetical protein PhCBS80983_g00430 [Powellomyces hirtus]|uniref:Ubiquitin thioesterase OTU n=1 Tax=Powellomyces hirtus TaxID=109895 RepID=A0A507EG55_9FUNG|nr:hypothetical protein PhCBS80983_g00430 [Powellomyces hirtus]